MAETSKIEWTEHTGGPYLGCEPVSAGCVHCYAWKLAEGRLEHVFRSAYQKAGFADWETRPVWGRTATRVLTKGFWKDARRINALHARAGTRARWFPSLIDWLDDMEGGIIDQQGHACNPLDVLADFLRVVHECGNIDWLLLTKNPGRWGTQMQRVLTRMTSISSLDAGFPLATIEWLQRWITERIAPANVWMGATVEDQPRADERVRELTRIPAVVRFLSIEPLLGEVDLKLGKNGHRLNVRIADEIDWIIVGGESDGRQCHVEWIRNVVQQCLEHGVRCFVKQLGSRPVLHGEKLRLQHPKGGDPAEWPEDLRVRQFPDIEGGVAA